MTLEEFTALPEQRQKQILVDADKVDERTDDQTRYEYFGIDNFIVEVKTSFLHKYRKIIHCYHLNDIPISYSKQVNNYLKDKMRPASLLLIMFTT